MELVLEIVPSSLPFKVVFSLDEATELLDAGKVSADTDRSLAAEDTVFMSATIGYTSCVL